MRRCRRLGERPRYPVITAASPAAQALASGSTGTTITFVSAAGGSGVYTYSAPSTSVGSVSGTAPGTVTLSGLTDGAVARVTVTVTDSRTGQTVVQLCVVSVATSVGATWSTTDYDFSDITASSTTATGTFTIYRADGTTPLLVGALRKETGTPTTTVSWSTAGVRLALASSSGSVLSSAVLDVSSLLPAGRGLDDGPIFVQMEVDGLIYGSSGSGTVGLLAGVASQGTTPATGNVSGSLYATRLSNGTYQEQARRLSVGTATLGAAQDNSSTVRTTQTLVVEIIGGRVQRLAWTFNGTGLLEVTAGGADVFDMGQAALNPTSGRQRDFTSGLHVFVAATVGSGATAAPEIRIKRVRVSTRTAPPSYP